MLKNFVYLNPGLWVLIDKRVINLCSKFAYLNLAYIRCMIIDFIILELTYLPCKSVLLNMSMQVHAFEITVDT